MTSGRIRKTLLAAIAAGMLLGPGQLVLAEESAEVQKTMEQSIERHQQTQKNEDTWAGKKAELMARHQFLISEAERLRHARQAAAERLDVEKKIEAETLRGIEGAKKFELELQPFLEKTLARLEESTAKGLPFLPTERGQRLASLHELLARADATGAEKTRRIMEALQIEADYGRSVEVYQDTVTLDGTPLLVDILRLGRVSLFCGTADGSKAGRYDHASRQFVSLPEEYQREITTAMEVARRERTAELVKLPIGRIELQ